MSEGVKNVFVSHVSEDEQAVGELFKLLASKGREIRDGSVTSETPNEASNETYIKSQILAPQINWAGTVIVAISPSTHTSQWVDWEIEYAEKKGKTIVGVWLPGAKDSDLPAALEKYADAIVGWNGESIIDAIDGKLHNWHTASGAPKGERQIRRHKC